MSGPTTLEPAQFGKKAKAVQPQQPKIYAKEEDSPYAWDHELLRLPRTMGCMAKDIAPGIDTPDQRADVVRRAKKGDEEALRIVNVALNVLIEFMGRHQVERQSRDPQGRLLFLDHNGHLTTRKFSQTINGPDERPLRHAKAMEMRSYWGVRAGADCITAPGTEVPQPGHYRTLVEANFDDLFPRLFFLSPELDPREGDPTAARPELRSDYMKYLRERCRDEDFRRKELLSWLRPFLKNPVATWTGEV